MYFYFLWESLKFYKLKNSLVVKLFFFGIFIFNFVFFILPIGDRNIVNLLAQLLLLSSQDNIFNSGIMNISISKGHIIYLISRVLIILINYFFALMYANAYSSEADGLSPGYGVVLCLKGMGKFLLFSLISIIVLIFSSLLLTIPYIFFITSFIFAPLFFTERKAGLFQSMRESLEYSRGKRSSIFLCLILWFMCVSWIESVLINFAGTNIVSAALISALINTFQFLFLGRLHALLYMYFTKYCPKSTSSFTWRDPRKMIVDIDSGKAPRVDSSYYQEKDRLEKEIQSLFPELYQRIKRAEEKELARAKDFREDPNKESNKDINSASDDKLDAASSKSNENNDCWTDRGENEASTNETKDEITEIARSNESSTTNYKNNAEYDLEELIDSEKNQASEESTFDNNNNSDEDAKK